MVFVRYYITAICSLLSSFPVGEKKSSEHFWLYKSIYIYIYIYHISYISYTSNSAHDSQIVHTIHCFKSFYRAYFADNQIGKIIENDIFRSFDILSFTRSSLHYTFSKFTIKYSSFYRFYIQLTWDNFYYFQSLQ